jgi:hypothetical protein
MLGQLGWSNGSGFGRRGIGSYWLSGFRRGSLGGGCIHFAEDLTERSAEGLSGGSTDGSAGGSGGMFGQTLADHAGGCNETSEQRSERERAHGFFPLHTMLRGAPAQYQPEKALALPEKEYCIWVS